MPVDLEYLRHHYASLSDEALRDINRAELVKEAQKIYDDELGLRKPIAPRVVERAETPSLPKPHFAGGKPDWLDDAAEVFSHGNFAGSYPAHDVWGARAALEAAGIPCYLELIEDPAESSSPARKRWRAMVPGTFGLHAASVIERDMFNDEFEAVWKSHLATLTDEELKAVTPEAAFSGLFDRVERVKRAYAEEFARRGMRSTHPE
jgi:hypothetical protein